MNKNIVKQWLLLMVAIFITACGGGSNSSTSTPVTPTSYPLLIQNSPGGSTNIVPGGSATFNISLNPNSTSAAKLKAIQSDSTNEVVQLSIQNAVTGVTLSTSQVTLSSTNPVSSFSVNVASDVNPVNPNQGMSVVAIVNGQQASFPLNLKVVSAGKLAFTNSTGAINMLLGSTQQATLVLTPISESQIPSVTANITSNSDNLQVTPSQCILNASNLLCQVTLLPKGIIGSYQISAVAAGYTTQLLNVNVTLPGGISFDTPAVNMLTSSTHTVNLSLSNAGVNDASQTVYLSTTGGSKLTVSPTSCTLSYAAPSCAVTVNSNGTAGSYNLIGQVNGTTIAPVYVTTSNPGSIVFQQESQVVILGGQFQYDFSVNLNMIGASSSLSPVLVTFTTDNESAIGLFESSQYLCSTNNVSCSSSQFVSGSVNTAGIFHVYANAPGYPQQTFTVYAYNAGTLQFESSNVSLLANGVPYQDKLYLIGASTEILPITASITSSGSGINNVSPSTCTFATNQDIANGCLVTITPSSSLNQMSNGSISAAATSSQINAVASILIYPASNLLTWSPSSLAMFTNESSNFILIQLNSLAGVYNVPYTVTSSNESALSFISPYPSSYKIQSHNESGLFKLQAIATFANGTFESDLPVTVYNTGFLQFQNDAGQAVESANYCVAPIAGPPTFESDVNLVWVGNPGLQSGLTASVVVNGYGNVSIINLPNQSAPYFQNNIITGGAQAWTYAPQITTSSQCMGSQSCATFQSYPTLNLNNTGVCP